MQQPTPRLRWLRQIEECLRASPVTVLLGARQVGKTTLARRVAEGRGDVTFFDLERATGREALSRTPELAQADCAGLVVIDEVQRLPALFEVLRPCCDDPDRRATYPARRRTWFVELPSPWPGRRSSCASRDSRWMKSA